MAAALQQAPLRALLVTCTGLNLCALGTPIHALQHGFTLVALPKLAPVLSQHKSYPHTRPALAVQSLHLHLLLVSSCLAPHASNAHPKHRLARIVGISHAPRAMLV